MHGHVRDQEGGKALTVVPDVWLFPLIRAGDPHWWLLYADVGGRQYYVLDPYSPNSAAPVHRVGIAQELLQWVLCALYGKSLCFEEMEYIPNYIYTLPQQDFVHDHARTEFNHLPMARRD